MEKAVKYVRRRKMQELLTIWRTKMRLGERQKAPLELKLTGDFYMKKSQEQSLKIEETPHRLCEREKARYSRL